MRQIDNSAKYHQLRAAFPAFVYESFSVTENGAGVRLEYCFRLTDDLIFRPEMFFTDRGHFRSLPNELKQSLAFHIGLVEMISYWKATCSPQILIKPFRLNNEQEQWWKKLFRYGLGEFFYTNGIEIGGEDLLSFNYPGNSRPFEKGEVGDLAESVIIPVGGGKDSAVTLELLKFQGEENLPMVMNHRGATRQVLKAAGYDQEKILEIKRRLDPLLLQLNDKGFLNGHTPFSALLAFVTVFAAALTGKRNIAMSNESSANEASIPGTMINHQYSKSFEFEQDFRNYLARHLIEGVNYFSFLRPLNEIQIGALFSRFKKYHPVFKSCNAGSKTDSWCCNCSKCLFTWIMLSPFIPDEKMIAIFGENLFEKAGLAGILDQLTGISETKPFECVGTLDEVNAALHQNIRQRRGAKLPALLQYYAQNADTAVPEKSFERFLNDFHEPHALEEKFMRLLKDSLKGLSSP